MHDTLRIVNDSINVALLYGKETPGTSNTHELCMAGVMGFSVLVVCIIVCQICKSIETSRQNKLNHEVDMLKLNSIKEERKQLLEFCYKMALKKESDTRESVKQPEKNIPKLVHDKAYDRLDAAFCREDKGKSTEGVTSQNPGITPKNKDSEYISLDQIRQECWTIIKEFKEKNINKDF